MILLIILYYNILYSHFNIISSLCMFYYNNVKNNVPFFKLNHIIYFAAFLKYLNLYILVVIFCCDINIYHQTEHYLIP